MINMFVKNLKIQGFKKRKYFEKICNLCNDSESVLTNEIKNSI